MGTLEILSSTLLGAVASAFVPLINAEVLVLSAVALAPRHLALPCIAVVTVGQMLGKSVLYLAGRGALRVPWLLSDRRMQEAGAFLQRRGGASSLVVFTSASTGLPPFYLTTLACGLLRMPFSRFAVLGFVGRLIRFSAVGVFPHLVRRGLP